MYDKEYKILNDKSKEKMLEIINKLFGENDKDLFDRCLKEIDLLYEQQDLFIIYTLYVMKNRIDIDYKLYFNKTLNNLYLLYVLGISEINPVEYNLPYELYNESEIAFYIDNFDWQVNLLSEFKDVLECEFNEEEDIFPNDDNFENIYGVIDPMLFELVYGYFKREKAKYSNINLENDKHYLILPAGRNEEIPLTINRDLEIETINDYREYSGKVKFVAFHAAYEVDAYYNFNNNYWFSDMCSKLNPASSEDYIKIISLGHSTLAWQNNQELLYNKKKISIKDIISNREDLFWYLVKHNIKRNVALEITNFVRKGRAFSDLDIINSWNDEEMKNKWLNPERIKQWEKYKKVIKKSNCDDWLIDVCGNTLFLSSRGQAVMEYLLLNKNGRFFKED